MALAVASASNCATVRPTAPDGDHDDDHGKDWDEEEVATDDEEEEAVERLSATVRAKQVWRRFSRPLLARPLWLCRCFEDGTGFEPWNPTQWWRKARTRAPGMVINTSDAQGEDACAHSSKAKVRRSG